MASLKDFFSIRRIIGLVLVPAAAFFIDHEFGIGWLTPALFTVYVAILLAAAMEHQIVPRPYLKLRKLHATAERKTRSNPILSKYYDQGVQQTRQALSDIIDDRFEFDIESIPTLSVDAMDLVDGNCLLTFPLGESESLLITRTGPAHQYDEAMSRASERIKSYGGKGVTRVFILDRRDDISQTLIEFMDQNINAGINVRILFKEQAPSAPVGLESLDFGYYERRDGATWVMILKKSSTDKGLTRYIVGTDRDRVQIYLRYALELIDVSMSFEDFMRIVTSPVNKALWPLYFAKSGYEMTPPHGLSDEDADYIVSLALRAVASPDSATVLVLGFTPKLIKRLVAVGAGNIISIDQCEIKPQQFQKEVSYETESWTDLSQEYDADAVIFDESINNLSKVQLGMFFASVARVLKPGGVLVGRAMGRFDAKQAERFGSLTEAQVVAKLRAVEGVSHSDFAPLVICLLHAKSMGFDDTLSAVSCQTWNNCLLRLRDERVISKLEYLNWHLEFDFLLLSPDQGALLREADAAGFGLAQMRNVEGHYAAQCPDTVDFYKIFGFELLSSNPLAKVLS